MLSSEYYPTIEGDCKHELFLTEMRKHDAAARKYWSRYKKEQLQEFSVPFHNTYLRGWGANGKKYLTIWFNTERSCIEILSRRQLQFKLKADLSFDSGANKAAGLPSIPAKSLLAGCQLRYHKEILRFFFVKIFIILQNLVSWYIIRNLCSKVVLKGIFHRKFITTFLSHLHFTVARTLPFRTLICF